MEDTLLAAQQARFAAVDKMLPEATAPPTGDPVEAATASGRRVSAIVRRHTYQQDSLDLLWSAAEVWQLFPLIGDTGTEGMDVLLRAWRRRMDAESPGPDSACLVTWPSRDAEAIRTFLDHGLVPISALAVRTAPPTDEPPAEDLTIRRAGIEDFEEALKLAAATFDYTALVASPGRPHTGKLLAPTLLRKLNSGGTVWLAESSGTAIGLADCGWIESTPGSWASELLSHGHWGYVNNVVTSPEARGSGVGRTLMATVHAEFHRQGARGTYLYYNPTNPLSSVFWHRQGYRPLWTFWETRPASALR